MLCNLQGHLRREVSLPSEGLEQGEGLDVSAGAHALGQLSLTSGMLACQRARFLLGLMSF